MTSKPISSELITSLIAPPAKPKKKRKGNTGGYPPAEQKGPVRWHDKEMRCALRGCSSSTFIKVEGIPICMTHTIHRLNDMLVERQGVL